MFGKFLVFSNCFVYFIYLLWESSMLFIIAFINLYIVFDFHNIVLLSSQKLSHLVLLPDQLVCYK
jgi:hypothetical protein